MYLLLIDRNCISHVINTNLYQEGQLAQQIGFNLAQVGSLLVPVVQETNLQGVTKDNCIHGALHDEDKHMQLQVPRVTLVMKPCPQTLWGRGRPQDMSMPGQYTAWKRRMSLPMMWLPGHPCCFRLSAVGSTPSGNRPGQHSYCLCTAVSR